MYQKYCNSSPKTKTKMLQKCKVYKYFQIVLSYPTYIILECSLKYWVVGIRFQLYVQILNIASFPVCRLTVTFTITNSENFLYCDVISAKLCRNIRYIVYGRFIVRSQIWITICVVVGLSFTRLFFDNNLNISRNFKDMNISKFRIYLVLI